MSSTLYDYYTAAGKPLPSVADRQGVAAQAGIQGYTGTADQNAKLLGYLQGGSSGVAQNGTTSGTNPVTEGTKTPPTLAQTYKDVVVPGVSDVTKAATDQANAYKTIANSTIDENAIKNDVMSRFQAQIDALNQVYAQKYAEADKAAKNREGSGRALQARSGVLGSTFADQQNATIEQNNQAVRDQLAAEKNAALMAVIGKGSEETVAEIARQRKLKEDAADKYVSTLETSKTSLGTDKTALAKAILAQGIKDVSQINPDKLKQIADTYGLDSASLQSLINDTNSADIAAKAKVAKENSISVTDGSTLVDPTTGKVIYDNVKNFAPKSSNIGSGTGGNSTPYSTDLDALVGRAYNLISSKNGKDAFQSDIAKARNDADKISSVASVVLKNAPANVRSDFTQQAQGIKNIDKAIAMIDSGTKTGALKAGTQYLYNIFGKDYDPNLAAVNSYVISAIQPYRSSITGAAWGPQEDAEYQSLFGSTKYSPTELRSRLVRIKEIMRDKSSTALSAQINPLSDTNIFDMGGKVNNTNTSTAPVDANTQSLRTKYNY